MLPPERRRDPYDLRPLPPPGYRDIYDLPPRPLSPFDRGRFTSPSCYDNFEDSAGVINIFVATLSFIIQSKTIIVRQYKKSMLLISTETLLIVCLSVWCHVCMDLSIVTCMFISANVLLNFD